MPALRWTIWPDHRKLPQVRSDSTIGRTAKHRVSYSTCPPGVGVPRGDPSQFSEK